MELTSVVPAPLEVVWRHASSMAGVNHELWPWMRMTYPADRATSLGVEVPVGVVVFRSWLIAGCLPFDRHALGFERILPGEGFDERSSSWLQRVWIHRRRLVAEGAHTRVTDTIEVEPRLSWTAPLVGLVVRALFRHRHRRLRALR